jgi:hypothetical protein
MRRSLAAFAVILPMAGACSEAGVERDSFHVWFQELRQRTDRGDESAQAVSAGELAALPIVRIQLDRSQVTDFSSLEVVFEGGENATRRGSMADWHAGSPDLSTAKVAFHEYARLCWLIESLDLPKASKSWSVRVSHREQRNISWTSRDGQTIELSDYGGACPPAVAVLAVAIENTARRLSWTAVEGEAGSDAR